MYRDSLASHEQRVRQATTVALPGLYAELESLEWRRIRTVVAAATTALNAWQAAARVACKETDNKITHAVQRLQDISSDCVKIAVDVPVCFHPPCCFFLLFFASFCSCSSCYGVDYFLVRAAKRGGARLAVHA